jgi:3'-phosphoadenosine 5'-phosphosulfate sulfotransferase (PAPS reductase)/FAD synthetase
VSDRSRRNRPAEPMFPGMPDVLPKEPPKAGEGEHVARTLDGAIARTFEILDEALAAHPIVGSYWLFSGGKDSVILGHLLRGRYDAILHVNTGTGIPQTTEHVHAVATAWGETLHELHPKNTYEDLVMGRVIASTGPNKGVRAVWKGFPGPPGHRVMYRHLKDEPLMRFRAEVLGDQKRKPRAERKKIAYLGGMRWGETERRFRNAEAIDPDGSIVWVSPIVHWTNEHMAEYRDRHRCQENHEHAPHRLCHDDALPLNPVTEHLHMSGECLCGAYAKPGELDEVEFFYPETAAKLRTLEVEAEAAGIKACRWGQKLATAGNSGIAAGRLCSSCTIAPQLARQTDLLDQWQAAGLLTAEQHANLAHPAA